MTTWQGIEKFVVFFLYFLNTIFFYTSLFSFKGVLCLLVYFEYDQWNVDWSFFYILFQIFWSDEYEICCCSLVHSMHYLKSALVFAFVQDELKYIITLELCVYVCKKVDLDELVWVNYFRGRSHKFKFIKLFLGSWFTDQSGSCSNL